MKEKSIHSLALNETKLDDNIASDLFCWGYVKAQVDAGLDIPSEDYERMRSCAILTCAT